MLEKELAVVTIVGKDEVGILATAATACAEVNANIVSVTQSVDNGFFTMMMQIDITELKGLVADLQQLLSERLPALEIHVMHANIFNAMHSI